MKKDMTMSGSTEPNANANTNSTKDQSGSHHPGTKGPKKLKVKVVERDSNTGVSKDITNTSLQGSTPRKTVGAQGATPIVNKVDSKYITVPAETLPSLGVFYPWDNFQIRKFNLMDIKKIGKANNIRNLGILVEALDSTVEGCSVSEFTVPDFWYLMYWHRINSYLSSPMIVNWDCMDDDHIRRTHLDPTDPEYLEPVTLSNAYTVTSSSIEDVKISNQEEIAKLLQETMDTYGVLLTAPRIGDLVESMAILERITDLENTVLQSVDLTRDRIDVNPTLIAKISSKVVEFKDEEWYNNLASMIEKPGYSLEQKREYLDELAAEGYGADLVLQFSKFEHLIDHGIKEVVTTKCAGCGVQTESNLSVDTFTFFPSL
jgi:hypothetical protein